MPINQQAASAIITPARARLLAAGPGAGMTGGGAGFFNSSAPAVSLSSSNLTFAPQQVGTKSSAQKVTLTNTGNATLDLTSMTLQGANSGDFVQNNTCGTSVAAGASCAINVTFTPKATGTRTASLSIADNAQGSPQTISLSGTGIAPAAGLSPASLTFPTQLINTGSAAQNVTLTNSGSAALNITAISFSGSDKGDFAQSNTCGTNVLMGASCTISVTFTPAGQNTRTAILSLKDNAPGSPQTVSLAGTGTIVQLSPASLSFGNQMVGAASSGQTITLANNSTKGALNISGISFTGSNQGDFSQITTCGASVPVGGNCTISVTFDPAATGSRSAALSISDTGGGSPQSISLSGTGTAPAVTLSPTSLSFGNQQTGTSSAAQTVGLTNTGSAALTLSGIAVGGANSSAFAQTNTCGTSVAAGASCTISVIFAPSVTGANIASVTIADNATGSPQSISLTGTGTTPAVTLSPANLSFGNQQMGTSSTAQTVGLTNTGSATLTLGSITVAGTNGGDFAPTNTCGTTVVAGASCTISVIFTPSAAGAETASVMISDNAGNSPQPAGLNGTGVLPLVPVASLSPPGLNFGYQGISTFSVFQILTLTNTGNGPLEINGIFAGGDFTQTNTCGTSVSAGASCTISVNFTPTILGAESGAITIDDNGAGSPQTVTLSGTGSDPSPAIAMPLVPSSTAPGATNLTLTVNGDGFTAGSVVNWNGTALATTFTSSTRLTASVPGANLAAAGSALVSVSNPGPGGGISNPEVFEVTAPTASVSFTRTDLSAGNAPDSIAVGDFNGDGIPDVAVANWADNTITVFLGNGDGTFQNPVTTAVGNGPTSAATGDFNQDGKLDLAVVNSAQGTVSILLGNGDGTFAPQVDYAAAGGAESIVVGDFSGDGELDLAITNAAAGTVSILMGNGDGTFQPHVDYPAGPSPGGLSLGDLNGDGKIDLVVANYASATVSILLGNGDGSFQAPSGFATGNGPSAVLVADLNADGKPDVATTNATDGTVSILLGNGDGTLQAQATFSVGQQPLALVTGDFNGDGIADLAAANSGNNTASVLLGNGDGTFQAALSFASGNGPSSLAASDFNRDGRLDLVVAGQSANDISLLMQGGVAGFSTSALTFGNQNVGSSSSPQVTTLTNNGSASLTVSSITIGGSNESDFSESDNCPLSPLALAPGASCTMNVTFTPGAAGSRTASLNIADNATGSPQTVSLSGTGTAPAVSLSPGSLLFGGQPLGTTSAVQIVTLTNTGSAPLGISSMVLGGANAGDFAQTNTCGIGVPAGASCAINVTFAPTATGARVASITIADNAMGSPQALGLTGTGLAQTVGLSQSSINFGAQIASTITPVHPVILTNTGSANLTVSGVAVNGANSSDITETNNCTSVAPLGTCNIWIQFAPGSTGARSATVNITDNAPGSPQTLSLSGTGISAPAATTDIYGGLLSIPCTNPNTYFILTKVNSRWWFCTPAGHALLAISVGNLVTNSNPTDDCNGNNVWPIYGQKYGVSGEAPGVLGTTYNWAWQTEQRMQAWGFNAVGQDTGGYVTPDETCPVGVSGCVWPGGTNPLPMPMIAIDKPLSYSSVNAIQSGNTGAPGATKDIVNGVLVSTYGNYRAMLGDIFDPNFSTYFTLDMEHNTGLARVRSNSPYVLGLYVDDQDYFLGAGCGPDFLCGGQNNPNLGWLTLVTAPNQTADVAVQYNNTSVVYPNSEVYSKSNATCSGGGCSPHCSISSPCSLRDYLYDEYGGSIAALNTAWGSHYTTFDSTGSQVTGESVGTGDGNTLVFTHTLWNAPASPNSVMVAVGGVDIAGDCGNGRSQCNAATGTGSIFSYTWNTISNTGSGSTPANPLDSNGYKIASVLEIGTTVTITLQNGSLPGWLTTGALVDVAAVSIGGYNGVFTVTGTGANTFTYTDTAGLGIPTAGVGTVVGSLVNYATGKMQLAFATGKAPASGAAVTVNYNYGGWGAGGTGLMDESGGTPWVGTNAYCLEGANSGYSSYFACVGGGGVHQPVPNTCGGTWTKCAVGPDIDNWVSQFSAEYFSTIRADVKASSRVPYLGLDQIGGWYAPAYSKFLQGAAPYLDGAEVSSRYDLESTPQFESAYQYTTQYLGDLPLINFSTQVAQDDSSMACNKNGNVPYGWLNSESDRASSWYNTINYVLNNPGYNGTYPFVSFGFWAIQDFQNISQGLVSIRDNPYDGVASCSTTGQDAWGYPTGGEVMQTWKPFSSFGSGTSSSPWTIYENVAGTQYRFTGGSSGTSGGTQPTWPTALGATVKDGSITWTNVGTDPSPNCYGGNAIGTIQSANQLWLLLGE